MPGQHSRAHSHRRHAAADRRRARPGRLAAAAVVAVAGVVAAVSLTGGTRAQAGGLAPPPVPAHGSYLGAFAAPDQSPTEAQSDIRLELSQIGTFDGTIGRPLGLVHVFQDWRDPVRTDVLAAFASTGAIPVVDWGCTTDASVISGTQDSLITSYAKSLAAYGRPVFLRWFWEMNLVGLSRTKTCLGSLGASGYTEAWQHIWNIFQQQGATNVAFVWCPSVVIQNYAAPYYPGDKYVDWIGFDGYDRKQDPNMLNDEFLPFYDHWISHGKPMMIAETGATTDQASYLADLATNLPTTFPGIKAVVYYDSVSTSNWTLTDLPGNLGLDQFIAMGQLPYFSYPFVGS